MQMTKVSTIAALATAALLATSASAFAANAVMNRDANVYKSNSSASLIVNDVLEDDEVTVTKCTTNWCFIKIPGPDGWVRKKYLAPLDEDGEAADIPFNFGMTMGPGGPTFSFGIGDAPPPPAPVAPLVCFFKGNNFTGASFCASPGSDDPQLVGGWNDTISSIKIQGGASTKVCRDWFYGGGCMVYGGSVAILPGAFNDQISAYKVN